MIAVFLFLIAGIYVLIKHLLFGSRGFWLTINYTYKDKAYNLKFNNLLLGIVLLLIALALYSC